VRTQWTPKLILKTAKQFSRTEDWRLNSHGSFSAAKRMGIYEKAIAHMKTNLRLTKEFVLADARKYNTKVEWKKASASAYKKARQARWLKEASAHMETKWRLKWNLETLTAEAKKYLTRNEWLRNSPSSYQAAIKLDVAEQVSTHMEWISHRNKWTPEEILKEAKKYKSKTEWYRNSPGSYEAAAKKGVFDLATSHMLVVGCKSNFEINLFDIVKIRFPKAHSTIFSNRDPQYVAKKFEIDVYVPELRKGIEFDGKYWHSLKGLKRGRPNWSDEQIENYHSYKDSFFKSRGIDILHIKEVEWITNKAECLHRVEKFLGVQNERN